MTEDKNSPSDSNNDVQKPVNSNQTQENPQQQKPLKPEEKPFEEFINDHLISTLSKAIEARGVQVHSLKLSEQERPVVGGNCWVFYGEISQGRRFWLCFSAKKITSQKVIALAEPGSQPTLLESFLIDERKTTLPLIVSRIIQRLNGQKWLNPN